MCDDGEEGTLSYHMSSPAVAIVTTRSSGGKFLNDRGHWRQGTVCVRTAGEMDGSCSSQSVDDDELEKSLKDSLAATLSKLKRKVLANRGVDVTDKMRSNSSKLRKYTNSLYESGKQWGSMSVPEEDKLTFRRQKVLHNFSSADGGSDVKDDGHTAVAPILFGCPSSGRTTVRPLKFPTQPNVPPYTTWIYLDRNQRMTEDQSVQGRRRIYYDPVGNETLIASDSEEEELDEEEPKHDFSKGEDYIIWTAVQERGAGAVLFEQISQCIGVKRDEVEARYELLLKDLDKQAKCAAHSEGIRLKVPSPVGRRKGTRDLGRLTYKETQSGPKEYVKTAGNGTTLKPEDEKVEAKDLVAAMDSFDNLFCRRCLVFDCRLHGCSQPLVHPSQKQTSTIPDSEPTVPCGANCYIQQPQQARGEVSDACLPALTDSQAGEFLCSGEGVDTPRVPKRQYGETTWDGEKQGAAITNIDGINRFSASTSQVYSHFGKSLKLSVNNTDRNVAPGQIAEAPVISSFKESAPVKRELPSVASRLTSHKKLARSSTRRALEGHGILCGTAQTLHKQVDFIDLTGTDEELSTENGNGPPKEVLGAMMGREMHDMATSEQDQVKHMSREAHPEEVTIHHERTRISSTKKLARSSKRPLEENIPLTVTAQHNFFQGDRIDVDQSEGTDVPVAKRLARTGDNGNQEKFTDDVRTPPRSLSVPMGISWTETVLFKDKSKGTSPKKLARSARKPILGELPDNVEGKKSQMLGKLLLPSQDPEQVVKEEQTNNTAARKLARSSRKVVAEKVAVAIQKHQLQSQVDLIGRSRGQKEHVKEEIVDTGGTSQLSVTAATIVAVCRGEHSHAQLAKCDSNQNSHILVNNQGDGSKDLEMKVDHVPAESSKVGIFVKGMAPKNSEGPSRNAEFKDNWTALEKDLYDKGLQIFGKNSCLIAKNMLKGCKTCAEVREHMLAQEAAAKRGFQYTDSMACVLKWDVARARARFHGRRKGSRKLKFTLKSAGQSAVRKRMVNGKDAPKRQYTPCGCLYFCGKQCPCQLNGTSCEKYCGCEKNCKNRFRGCHCAKSQCCSRQCPCFASDRECDPDVCRNCWIGCGDGEVGGPPRREDRDNYQCQNMKLLLKQQQRVLLSRSNVAGWGAFLKNTVSKHEYLGEYTGELISHREADKRGKIYDRENSSFLFNLNDQYVLDACRKGDKLKFANHSPSPNCYAKVMMVAGDHRVGIFAKERILAGEELFYDYRYEPERAPAWARRGDDISNGKKDDPGPSERRSKQAS